MRCPDCCSELGDIKGEECKGGRCGWCCKGSETFSKRRDASRTGCSATKRITRQNNSKTVRTRRRWGTPYGDRRNMKERKKEKEQCSLLFHCHDDLVLGYCQCGPIIRTGRPVGHFKVLTDLGLLSRRWRNRSAPGVGWGGGDRETKSRTWAPILAVTHPET